MYGSDSVNAAGCITSNNFDTIDTTIDSVIFMHDCSWTIDNCHSNINNFKTNCNIWWWIMWPGIEVEVEVLIVTITNCTNQLDIGQKAGGICGQYVSNYEIMYCSNYGDIAGNYAGGICGSSSYEGTIKYCSNEGEIGGGDNGGSGGICGLRAGQNHTLVISYCYNTGRISLKIFGWYMWSICRKCRGLLILVELARV